MSLSILVLKKLPFRDCCSPKSIVEGLCCAYVCVLCRMSVYKIPWFHCKLRHLQLHISRSTTRQNVLESHGRCYFSVEFTSPCEMPIFDLVIPMMCKEGTWSLTMWRCSALLLSYSDHIRLIRNHFPVSSSAYEEAAEDELLREQAY